MNSIAPHLRLGGPACPGLNSRSRDKRGGDVNHSATHQAQIFHVKIICTPQNDIGSIHRRTCDVLYGNFQVVYVTAVVPYVVLLILLIWNVQLEGAWLGIQFYIIPQWSKLANPKVRRLQKLCARNSYTEII